MISTAPSTQSMVRTRPNVAPTLPRSWTLIGAPAPTSVQARGGQPARVRPMAARDPAADLRQIAFLLERAHEATYRVRAFRSAASALAKMPREELEARAAAGTLTELSGVGAV